MLARQKLPLWVTSTCQMVGPRGTMPALRTAPMRAMRLPFWAVRVPAWALAGEKVPGPRKVRVPPPARTMTWSPARSMIRALSGSERPAG